MKKKEIMEKLIDLYEQREFTTSHCTKLILDDYIRKLELELAIIIQQNDK